ncbi:M15 family metallopeptidase [Dichotomicrobium thermohalophilum]|uniref:M15 family metallopeptidase n=1 Tax=Dichotomicrobium thermohalophilum TaxID=933063 RepID=UPI001473F860|nr:M15 family metallopeptidase [Dichotomicrobium thermohalophilum]
MAVDEADPRAAEPLVDLSDYGLAGKNYYARTDGGNAPYHRAIAGHINGLWARRSVAEKLVRVNRGLQEWGFRLFVWDAYRPAACQQGLWAFWWEQARQDRPDADDASIRARVLEFVSDPSRFDPGDPATIPTHATGAAIDLTLQHLDTGALAEMGAGFDEMSPRAASDYFERALERGDIAPDDPQLLHRRLLHFAMRAEGFVNYPPEFWHFDWGNQMYVRNLAAIGGDAPRAAWYGYVRPPEGESRTLSEPGER